MAVRSLHPAVIGLLIVAAVFIAVGPAWSEPPPPPNPIVFPPKQPLPSDGGGLVAHDLNNDGPPDIVVTSKGYIGAYELSGMPLWVRKADIKLLKFLHHTSAIAGDMDSDGYQEVTCLVPGGRIEVLDGKTGELKRTLSSLGEPTALAIADLRGEGDRNILLQHSQTRIKAIRSEDGQPMWETEEYRGIEHSPLRQADLDDDGRDEVAGASIIDHDGSKMNRWDLGGAYANMDSLVIADIVPGLPLEVALAEQRGANSHTDVVNHERVVFRALDPWNWEDPDKLAVGDFDPKRPGLEVFNHPQAATASPPEAMRSSSGVKRCHGSLTLRAT